MHDGTHPADLQDHMAASTRVRRKKGGEVPELHSPSKQYDSQGSPSSDPVFVRGSERKFAALRKFQVGSVVQGEPVAFRQSGANYPCPVSGFRI